MANNGLLGGFLTPENMGLLGAASGLLQAGGPSKTPVSLGQALGQGVQSGLMGFQQGTQMQSHQQKADAQKKQQEAIAEFAKTLPPDHQTRFLADPASYIKATTPKAPEAFTLPAGGIRFGPDGKPIASAPTKPEISPLARLMDEQKQFPPGTPQWKIYEDAIKRAATHAPAAQINNAPVINAKVGDGLGSNVKEIVSETRSAALGALGTIETADRIGKALEGGNVNLGPTASLRTKGDQFAQVLGIAGANTQERLVNTRNVMRGLAQQTVEARKKLRGQGQVTENEGKLIARAESGEIDDFTIPELKDFLGVSKRLARKVHAEHKRIVGVMGGDESTKGLVPYYDVDDLPAEPTQAAPAVRRFNPKTGKIE